MNQKSIALTKPDQKTAYGKAREFVDANLEGKVTDGDLAKMAFAALLADPTAEPVDDTHKQLAESIGKMDPSRPTCNNCGSHVMPQYVRVFSANTVEEGPDACPHCEDLVRRMGEVREKR